MTNLYSMGGEGMRFFKKDRQRAVAVLLHSPCYTTEYFAALVDAQKQRNTVVDNANKTLVKNYQEEKDS